MPRVRSVRISDRALVVAAELSDRYITSRYLPDKVGSNSQRQLHVSHTCLDECLPCTQLRLHCFSKLALFKITLLPVGVKVNHLCPIYHLCG